MSKALELADKLEKLTESGLWYDGKPAAAELRRLAAVEAERDALKAELERIGSLEPVYAYRRKGLEYFCTCDEARYLELSDKQNLFEVCKFYTMEKP